MRRNISSDLGISGTEKQITALSVDLCDLEQIASLRDCGCACRACASLGGGDLEKCLHILALSHPSHILAPENVIPESLSSTTSSPHAALMSRSSVICQSFQFYIISKLMKVYAEGLVCVLFWNTFWKTLKFWALTFDTLDAWYYTNHGNYIWYIWYIWILTFDIGLGVRMLFLLFLRRLN